MARRKHDDAFLQYLKDDSAQATGTNKKIRRTSSLEILGPATKECSSCMSRLDIQNFPSRVHAGAIQHQSEVCQSCWEENLQVAVEEQAPDRISCAECELILDESDIKELARKEVYDKYVNLLTSPRLH